MARRMWQVRPRVGPRLEPVIKSAMIGGHEAAAMGDADFETLVPFDEPNHNRHFFEFSPVGRVPVLKHGDLVLWESLAILEYLAETFPDARLWPADVAERARARVISNEMHAGFGALRANCPMNMRRPIAKLPENEAIDKDVRRINAIWTEALDASGGPFLFGEFSNADAMYAPVVNRLNVYDLTDDETSRAYMATMMGLASWQEWEQAGRDEPWIVEEDEA